MMRSIVIAVLLALTVLVGAAPRLHPPAGTLDQANLAAFQISVIALACTAVIALLLVASWYDVFWKSFVHPGDYRQSIKITLRNCGWLLAGGALVLLGFFVVSFYYFWANTSEGPLMRAIDRSVPGIVALIVVGEAIGIARALALFLVSRHTTKEP